MTGTFLENSSNRSQQDGKLYKKQQTGYYMDIIDGCAPFVLTMTLECSPDDAESLLGFKPQKRN